MLVFCSIPHVSIHSIFIITKYQIFSIPMFIFLFTHVLSRCKLLKFQTCGDFTVILLFKEYITLNGFSPLKLAERTQHNMVNFDKCSLYTQGKYVFCFYWVSVFYVSVGQVVNDIIQIFTLKNYFVHLFYHVRCKMG